MVDGLVRVGIEAEALEDGIFINGGVIQGGTIDSRHDHRIAMAFSIAGAVANDSITIEHCENIATSFPTFLTMMNQINLSIRVNTDE